VIRIVLDTNVIVSALVFGGLPRAVFELVEAEQYVLFYSQSIQAEVRRVLQDKFDWPAPMLNEVLPVVWSTGELVVPQTEVNVVSNDPDDNRIIECALEANAYFIVSGDRHLLALRSYHSISIVSPRQLLEAYLADQG
jgi:putative PIN family toxin of toxin-antitoxin system